MNEIDLAFRRDLVLKEISELPEHITIEEYHKMLDSIDNYFDGLKETEERKQNKVRDKLFIILMWVTGGRVSDICGLKISDFDFLRKEINMWIKKKDSRIKVTLNDSQLLDVSNYIRAFQVKEKLFGFSRQYGWKLVKKYGSDIRKDIHPHHFRHGMAIHSMNNGVPIPVISARLGHSNIRTTMEMYLKVTPDIQRKFYDKLE